MDIGSRIKTIRGKESQADFGTRLGKSRNTIMRYEANDRTPDSDFLLNIYNILGIEPKWVLVGEGPMHKGEQDSIQCTQAMSAPPKTAAQGQDITDVVNIQELMNMTAEVLVSDTVYRPALAANIKAFHRSIALEHDNKELISRMETMEQRMTIMEQKLTEATAVQPQKVANG